MKKTIAFILAAVMLFMFVGCVSNGTDQSSQPMEGSGATIDNDRSKDDSLAESSDNPVSGGEDSSEADPSSDSSPSSASHASYAPDNTILSGLFDNSDINYEYNADLINILLIGSDSRDKSQGRSDSMIILSINKTKKTLTFTSLMRDLYVSIPGHKDNRINAAYSAGGPALLMKTIAQNFGIQLDYYVRVGFSSFQCAVDALGGIDIKVNSNNYDYFKRFDSIGSLSKEQATDGTRVVHIDGATALSYARNRSFAGSDFTRTLHQRDLLSQLVTNCKGSSLSELHEMLKTVLPYVVTNIPKDMLKMMVFEALDYIGYDVVTARVPCNGAYKNDKIRGMSVLVPDMQKNKKYLYSVIFGE